MKMTEIKKIIKETVNEITSQGIPNDKKQIHVQGYGIVSEEGIKSRILEALKEATQAFQKNDWKTLNHLLGRTGNGVVPEFITAIHNTVSDMDEGFGYVYAKDRKRDPKHIKNDRWTIKFPSNKDLKKHGG
jgi:hypothetical protein